MRMSEDNLRGDLGQEPSHRRRDVVSLARAQLAIRPRQLQERRTLHVNLLALLVTEPLVARDIERMRDNKKLLRMSSHPDIILRKGDL